MRAFRVRCAAAARRRRCAIELHVGHRARAAVGRQALRQLEGPQLRRAARAVEARRGPAPARRSSAASRLADPFDGRPPSPSRGLPGVARRRAPQVAKSPCQRCGQRRERHGLFGARGAQGRRCRRSGREDRVARLAAVCASSVTMPGRAQLADRCARLRFLLKHCTARCGQRLARLARPATGSFHACASSRQASLSSCSSVGGGARRRERPTERRHGRRGDRAPARQRPAAVALGRAGCRRCAPPVGQATASRSPTADRGQQAGARRQPDHAGTTAAARARAAARLRGRTLPPPPGRRCAASTVALATRRYAPSSARSHNRLMRRGTPPRGCMHLAQRARGRRAAAAPGRTPPAGARCTARVSAARQRIAGGSARSRAAPVAPARGAPAWRAAPAGRSG